MSYEGMDCVSTTGLFRYEHGWDKDGVCVFCSYRNGYRELAHNGQHPAMAVARAAKAAKGKGTETRGGIS